MKFLKIVLAVITLVLSTGVNAALLERLDGLAYYDTEANLTWLSDANYAVTSGYASSNDAFTETRFTVQRNGSMGWVAANDWTAGLNISGVTGWRLPDTIQPDPACSHQLSGGSSGYNCTGSEMGNMFYNVLGGSANTPLSSSHNANYDLFSNIQDAAYWTATERAPGTNDYTVWYFNTFTGTQSNNYTFNQLYSWAVYDGDVSAVPVPAAVWLFGTGLIGLLGFSRRKQLIKLMGPEELNNA